MAAPIKTELLGMNKMELEEFVLSLGEPRYRASQIHAWMYRKQISSFNDMSDIPQELRLRLAETAEISIPPVLKQRVSSDGTRKLLLAMKDNKAIETVIIPQRNDKNARYSLCVSTQVGCPIGCSFCATGQAGFQRNLQAFEMVGQVLSSSRELSQDFNSNGDHLITNVVYMGMGEPLLNYDEVIKSICILNDHQGINIGQRHITISTAGEVKGIKRLSQSGLQVILAISLHACNNELRDQLIPLNRKYPLEILVDAVQNYIALTNRRVTFEYIMLDGINIGAGDAEAMIKLIRPLLANVNLIPYNGVDGLEFKKPSAANIRQFYNWLVKGGLNVTLREEKGADIEAACGQLRGRSESWQQVQ